MRYSQLGLQPGSAASDGQALLRLGLRMVKGFGEAQRQRLVQARAERRFRDSQDLCDRAGLDKRELSRAGRSRRAARYCRPPPPRALGIPRRSAGSRDDLLRGIACCASRGRPGR